MKIMDNLTNQVIGNIWESKDIIRNLMTLADDIGPRPSGSNTAKNASEFLESKLIDYGLNIKSQEFLHPYWERKEVNFRVDNKHISVTPFHFTSDGEITSESFILKNPNEKVFESAKFEGKVLFVEPSRTPHGGMGRKEMYKKAIEGGASAFVQMTNIPGGITETGSIISVTKLDKAIIPAVSCSYETGKLIERKIKHNKGNITLNVKGNVVDKKGINVIGDLNTSSEKTIILGAHYDTWDIGPGAFDNGTGVVTVLGLIESLVEIKDHKDFPYNIRAIFFSAEEIDLLGSQSYVTEFLNKETNNISLMMNFDCTNIKNGVRGAFTSNNMLMHNQIVNFVNKFGFDVKMSLRPPHNTDAFPFFQKKIPTFNLAQFTAPSYMHTAWDTVDKVSEDGLKYSTAISGAILADLMTNSIF